MSVRTATALTINTDQITQTVLDTIKGGGGGFGEGGIFDIRQEFVDTPYWNATLTTDENGVVTFSVTLPDNLTTWRLDARALTDGADDNMLVGQATADLLSTKPLLIRPVTPRFFVVGDEVAGGGRQQQQRRRFGRGREPASRRRHAGGRFFLQPADRHSGGRARAGRVGCRWWMTARKLPI